MKRRQFISGCLVLPALGYLPWLQASEQPLLVKQLVEMPRNQLQLWVVDQIRAGRLAKVELLKALLSAGVSHIEPRPVGFKYHAVMMVDAARRLSAQATGPEAWIPLLWNLDYFKHSQARSQAISGWTLSSPPAQIAMDRDLEVQLISGFKEKNWALIDATITQQSRTQSAYQLFERLLPWAVKDFHSIGHKAVLFSGIWRTLEATGWRDSETILRGMSFALMADGAVSADTEAGWWLQDYAPNLQLAKQLPDMLFLPGARATDTEQLLNTARTESADKNREGLHRSVASGLKVHSLWDAIFLAAADAVMNRPTIPMLHTATVSHAFYALWQRTANPLMRRLIPLQALSYVVQMKQQRQEGGWNNLDILEFGAKGAYNGSSVQQHERLGESLGYDPQQARLLILRYPLATEWWSLKQQLNYWLLYKSNKAHDFKFGAAVLETIEWLSPQWRSNYLAGCSRLLMGSNMPDSVEGQKVDEWLS